MKIRHGFVSNSSSSSFIVEFPVIPKSIKEIKKLLFNNEEKHLNMSTHDMSKIILNDIKEEMKIKKLCIKYKIFDDPIKSCIEVKGDTELIMKKIPLNSEKSNNYWDIYQYIEKIKIHNISISELKTKFIFTYSDENSDFFSVMEHGNIFEKLKHEIISNH